MEIAIATDQNKIIVNIDKEYNSYAVLIPQIGEPIRMTIEQLIESLHLAIDYKKEMIEKWKNK